MAGWQIVVFASPKLAVIDKNFVLSITFHASACPPFTLNVGLLHAYSENPAAWGDDFGIPESNNGVADILDEIKWGLDWLTRMQNADGSVLSIEIGRAHV